MFSDCKITVLRCSLDRELISEFRERVADADLSFLNNFVERESDIYSAGDHVVYRVRDFAITVLLIFSLIVLIMSRLVLMGSAPTNFSIL